MIYCNDCSAKSTVKYHWLGLRCGICDSYNTAQIQILSEVDHTSVPLEGTDSPLSLLSQELVASRPTARGRSTSLPIALRRSASASGFMSAHGLVHDARRALHSESVDAVDRLPLSPLSFSSSEDPSAMDTDEDYSDVDFWGGESPRSRNRSPCVRDEEVDDESSDEDEDDDDDDEMTDDAEGDEDDQMELFGHR